MAYYDNDSANVSNAKQSQANLKPPEYLTICWLKKNMYNVTETTNKVNNPKMFSTWIFPRRPI